MVNILKSKGNQQTRKSKSNKIVTVVYVGIIIFGIMAILSLIRMSAPIRSVDINQNATLEPKGVLYTSMAKEGEPLSVQTVILSEQNTVFGKTIAFDGATTMQFESSSLNKSFVVFSPIVPNSKTEERSSNIMVIDGNTKALGFALPEDNMLTGIKHLDYSEASGLLTFTAQEQELSDSVGDPESVHLWNIYITDPKTQSYESIGKGADSVWSPDGNSLIYLSEHGLKHYSLLSKETTDVVINNASKKISFGTNMNLDISPNGQLLAISSPNDGAILFFDIAVGNPVSISPSDAYPHIVHKNTAFYWPTFSYDRAFVAVQAADVDSSQNQTNPRIEIIRLVDGEVVKTIPIDEFDFTRAFIDAWEAN